MADTIVKIDSQGTKIWIVDQPATAWADCSAATTALLAGKQVGCPQSIGDITETRSVNEIKCLSSNASVKSLGAISRGSIAIDMLYDPDDAKGQAALRDAFVHATPIVIGIELSNNKTPSAATKKGNGTIYYFNALISGVTTGIAQDSAVVYKVTIEIAGEIMTCPAVLGT